MGGRHRTAADPGFPNHRQRRGLRTRALIVPAVLLVLTAGTATALAARTGALGCLGSQTKLRIAASPDIAPALDKIAQRFRDGEIGAAGRCVDLTVVARESQQVVEQLASTGQGGSQDESFDIWVPESSVHVEAARSAQQNPDRLLPAGSVAHSPVVVALIRPLADQLKWQEAKLGWGDLLKRAAAPTAAQALRLGVVDPNRSATSMLGLMAVRNVASKAGQTTLLGAMRAVSSNVSPTERTLLDQLPQTRAEVTDPAQRRLHAFPYSEQGVWRYNIASPSVPLAAIYPADGAPQLDYPYVIVGPGTRDEDRRKTAADFLEAIQGPQGRKILQAQAFRTTTDEAGPAVSPVSGLRGDKPPAALEVKRPDIEQTMRIWTIVNLDARMLAVFDISGSMLTVDPGARASRVVLTREGAAGGLALLTPESEVGLWVFSTNLAGSVDYAEILDVGRLGESFGGSTRRDILNAKLSVMTAKKGGATGLYDTALAAYRKMVAGYNPKMLNSVVLFTDGKNEDPSSISFPALITELKKLYNPKKPVVIYTIGYGTAVDGKVLQAISAATGGQAVVTTDPNAIRDVFLKALAQRAASDAAKQQ